MKHILVFSRKIVVAFALLFSAILFAQDSYKENFNVTKDAVVTVNVSYADVVFETWNKNTVEVEAYIDGVNLSEKEKKEIFKNWNLDVLGNSKRVMITSKSGDSWDGLASSTSIESRALEGLKGLEALKDMPILKELKNMDWNVTIPDVPDYKKFPNWPFTKERPKVTSDEGTINFNFNDHNGYTFNRSVYQRDKEAYLAKLNKKYNKNVSVRETDAWLRDVDSWAEGFEKVMEDWGEKFGNEFEVKFGPEFEQQMEEWGENFGKSMESWGENFGKSMEAWGENFGEEMEKWAEQFENEDDTYSKEVITDKHGNKTININTSRSSSNNRSKSKAKKKIIIRMPKGIKTDINIRHGEVRMADVYNVNATLNYAPFVANSIDGGQSLINASYGPVSVNNWVQGVLKVNYVEDCKLNTVQDINLQANSSNVIVNTLEKTGILVGSFGNLFIGKVAPDFNTVDISLENTDAILSIPNTAFSFYFNGKKSPFSAPASLEIDKNVSGGRVLLNGYYKASNSQKKFNINAIYSNVTLQN